MKPQFVRIGSFVINLANVTYIELADGTLTIQFTAGQPLAVGGEDAKQLKGVLANPVYVIDPATVSVYNGPTAVGI